MTSNTDPPSVVPFGDRGVVVEFDDDLSPAINGRVRELARRVERIPGVAEVVPTFRSLLVVLDPSAPDRDALRATILDLSRRLPAGPGNTGRTIEIPAVYGGEAGPDLADVAQTCGLTTREVIELHSREPYLVFMLGFAPGFPYLGVLPAGLRTRRLASPRTRVPPGSVGVADLMTGIYPLPTAGGWNLIGRTSRVLYDPRDPSPVLLSPGDLVRFVPVSSAIFPDGPDSPPLAGPVGRPAFQVRESGLYSTVQDLGRSGYRALGLPAAGAMDQSALQIANLLVGNAPAAAAVECTAPGPVLRAVDELTIALTGADLSPALDGAELEMWTPLEIRAGQTLSFGAPRRGMWTYVAVAGGIDVPEVLGSASTYVPGRLGGVAGRRLLAGDVLGRGEGARRFTAPGSISLDTPEDGAAVRVIPGPQEAWFDDGARAQFWADGFRVGVHSDRAGVRLEGPVVRSKRAAMLSDGMLPGAVQVPGSGQPIVIMADGPTTGGYPKIGIVATADLRLVAQARPGTALRFVPATVAEGLDALRAWTETLAALQGQRRDL